MAKTKISAVVEVGGLEVPVCISVHYYHGAMPSWNDPGSPPELEMEEIQRTDGLQMHDGVERAADAWLYDHGWDAIADQREADAQHHADWSRGDR